VIGFCLAAGAGTRLEPLTRVTPKPLLAPAGRPLVDLAVEALQRAGATRVVVNAHHGADLLVARLAGRSGVEVVVERVLLGTGGGLVNAARLGLLGSGDDPVLVTAADHVVDPADLADLAAFLERSGAPMAAGLIPAGPAPFGLRLEAPPADPPGSRAPAAKGSAGGRAVRDPGGRWDSAGAYAVRAGLLCELEPGPATLSGRVLGPLLDRGRLTGLPFTGPVADAGTLARLLDVSAGLLTGRWPYRLPPGRLRQAPGTGPVFVAKGAEVDPTAVLAGPVVLDAGARVGAGAAVTRSVVGPRAVVGAGARVTGSFLGSGAQVPPGAAATAALVAAQPTPTCPGGPGARQGEHGGDSAG
jgi:NDP-sugar pyrophosphorylase family protein